MRNANGSGTVYKLKGRRHNPWIARSFCGCEIAVNKKTGAEYAKANYETIGYFKTKDEAQATLFKNRLNPLSPKRDITLQELYTEWSNVYFKNISRSTADNYSSAWLYLTKYGRGKFADLRTSQMQDIVDNAEKSRSTLSKIKILCGLLYKYAMQNDIVNRNYAEFIRLPKEGARVEHDIMSDLDIKVLQENDDIQWVKVILILIYTGMRISEMLNLTRFSVDLQSGIITGGVKTDAGKNRIIPIGPKIMPYIKYWYDKKGDTLICNAKGKKIDTKTFRDKCFYETLELLNIKKVTPHTTRHTFATLMARASADPLSIQRIMGHTNYAFTANNYTHPYIEELKKAINLIC